MTGLLTVKSAKAPRTARVETTAREMRVVNISVRFFFNTRNGKEREGERELVWDEEDEEGQERSTERVVVA
jgi:hypothetical protein